MKPHILIMRYGAFAVLATIANLAAQRGVLALTSGKYGFMLAVLVGTGVGLVLKYLLDKRWIFLDTTQGAATHSKKFSLYTLTGVITTAIFWGSETAFWLVGQTEFMRELGAVLGLAIGYVLKYQLDRKFVFPKPPA